MITVGSLATKLGVSALGPLVAKHWKVLVIVLLIGLNAAQWEWYWPNKVEKWRTKYDDTTKVLLVCELSRTELKTTIDKLNSQVDLWVTVSTEQQLRFDQLGQKLDDLSNKTDAEVAAILNTPVPKDCSGSMDYLKQSIDQLNW